MKNFCMYSLSESLIKYAMQTFYLIHQLAYSFAKVISADILVLMLDIFSSLIVSTFMRLRNLPRGHKNVCLCYL